LSAFGRSLSKPLLVLGGMTYFAVLFIQLVWWHVPPETVLALTIGGIGLVVLSLRPFLGIHVFIMTLFLENVLGVGVRGVSPMKIIGAVVLASWLLNVALARRTGIRFDRFVLVVGLFLAWCGVSLLYAVDTSIAVNQTFSYLQLALAALMFSSVVNTPERARSVYWSFVVWTTLNTLVAMGMYYLGLTRKAVGLVGNTNGLASLIDVAIICAYLLHQMVRPGLGRILLSAVLPVLFLGLALTFSRAGLIILAVTVLLVWYNVARQRGFLLLIGSISMICVLAYVLPNAFWKRAESIVPAIQRQQDTFGTRVRLWRVALRMIEDRPVVGVGPGNFVAAYPRYARGGDQRLQNLPPHNTYVGVSAETGLVGGTLFVLIIAFSLMRAHRAVSAGRATARSDLETLGVAAEVSLLVFLIGGLSGDSEGLKCVWMFFGLAVAAGQMAERLVAQERPAAADRMPIASAGSPTPWALARHHE